VGSSVQNAKVSIFHKSAENASLRYWRKFDENDQRARKKAFIDLTAYFYVHLM
jgi:hypothetical protein